MIWSRVGEEMILPNQTFLVTYLHITTTRASARGICNYQIKKIRFFLSDNYGYQNVLIKPLPPTPTPQIEREFLLGTLKGTRKERG